MEFGTVKCFECVRAGANERKRHVDVGSRLGCKKLFFDASISIVPITDDDFTLALAKQK